MRLLRKLLLAFGVIAIATGIVTFFAARHALTASTAEAAPLINRAIASFGLELTELTVEKATIGFPATARWTGLAARVESQENSPLARQAGFELNAELLRFRPISFGFDQFRVGMSGVEGASVFVSQANSGPQIGGFWFRFDSLAMDIPISPREPMEGLRDVLAEISSLFEKGETRMRIQVSGEVGFRYENVPITLKTSSTRRNGVYGLEADREGVEKLVSLSDSVLTPAEIELVSKYPLQAPHMLYIFNYAVHVSQEAANRDASVPQDAYRHLLWSFLLTKRFGPQLAEEITDAHEIGSTTNTEADHRMDYHNNDLGRGYALDGRSESEILGLAKRDPRVVREPR